MNKSTPKNLIDRQVKEFRKSVGVLYDKHKGVEDELRRAIKTLAQDLLKRVEGEIERMKKEVEDGWNDPRRFGSYKALSDIQTKLQELKDEYKIK